MKITLTPAIAAAIIAAATAARAAPIPIELTHDQALPGVETEAEQRADEVSKQALAARSTFDAVDEMVKSLRETTCIWGFCKDARPTPLRKKAATPTPLPKEAGPMLPGQKIDDSDPMHFLKMKESRIVNGEADSHFGIKQSGAPNKAIHARIKPGQRFQSHLYVNYPQLYMAKAREWFKVNRYPDPYPADLHPAPTGELAKLLAEGGGRLSPNNDRRVNDRP